MFVIKQGKLASLPCLGLCEGFNFARLIETQGSKVYRLWYLDFIYPLLNQEQISKD